MRDLFDRRLTDPTAAEVVEALRAAEAAVNAGHTVGNLVHVGGSAPAIAARVCDEPAGMTGHFGWAQQADIGRLSLGWWTNFAGRKLAPVRGWRERSLRYGPDDQQTEEFDQSERDRHRRPGVWHVEHERVVEVSDGGEPVWVAVCGCGAAGSAESLGWHHGMCGPCADRVAEFGPEAVSHAPGLLADADFEPRDVLFTADGAFVVAVADTGYRVWDAATGAPHARATPPSTATGARPGRGTGGSCSSATPTARSRCSTCRTARCGRTRISSAPRSARSGPGARANWWRRRAASARSWTW